MNKTEKRTIAVLLSKKKEEKKKREMEALVEMLSDSLAKAQRENVSISNLSELAEYVNLEFPESFSISNLEELAKYLKFPEPKDFPKSFAISNLNDLGKYIKFPEQKEFPKELRVSNFPEIKTEKVELPDSLSKLSLKNTEKFLSEIYARIGAFAQGLKNGFFVSNKKPSESIPVRLVDKYGKDFINPSGGGGQTAIGITNTQDERIDPATETTQADHLFTYKLSDISEATDTYLGYLKKNGAWYIAKYGDDGSVKYVKGDSGYDFSQRESLDYQSFNITF